MWKEVSKAWAMEFEESYDYLVKVEPVKNKEDSKEYSYEEFVKIRKDDKLRKDIRLGVVKIYI